MRHFKKSGNKKTKGNRFRLAQPEEKREFLTIDEQERFEERAAIMEYEGGLPRQQAEQEAFACVLRSREYTRQAG